MTLSLITICNYITKFYIYLEDVVVQAIEVLPGGCLQIADRVIDLGE